MAPRKRGGAVPLEGAELRAALFKIAAGYKPEQVDRVAVTRYVQDRDLIDSTKVTPLARSKDPKRRQTARLRAAAMLEALDQLEALDAV